LPSGLAAPHALRDNAAGSVRGIPVAAAAYVPMTAGDVARKWARLPAGPDDLHRERVRRLGRARWRS